MQKAVIFRRMLDRLGSVILAGAHHGLSARLVEEAGFDAVWASSFDISASHAVPDANILSMAENLAVAKNINDSVTIPIIADCDNGYGNAINVMRMVQEYERAGIAGVCIEDNDFPKRCSFYTGVKRELETIRYFDNDRYEETNVLASLFCAKEALEGRVLVLYGDILFDTSIVEKLLRSLADITIVVDHAWAENDRRGIEPAVSRPELVKTLRQPVPSPRFLPDDRWNTVLRIGRALDQREANAEFIGMALFSEKGLELVKAIYRDALRRYSGKSFHEAATLEQASLSDFLTGVDRS